MIYTLLTHQWKAFWRSKSAGRNLAVQIFMGLIILYLLSAAIFMGIYLHSILEEAFPEQDPVTVYCGLILYFFLLDIFSRFLMQDLPTLVIQPYLVQNVKRSRLVQFLNLRSLVSFFNVFPLFLFIPFALSTIKNQYGSSASFAFVITIISLILFNNFLVLFIKRKTVLSNWWMVGFFVVVLVLMAGDYFKIFSVQKLSASVFGLLLSTPSFCIAFIVLAIGSYYNNTLYLKNNLYLDDLVKSPGHKASSEYHWLQRFGNIGDLIAIDLKLIIRNKRPRSLLLLSCIFLLYGFLLYKPAYFDKDQLGSILFGAIFITGMFMMNYGQFLFAWQSTHFDGLMASNVNLKTYIKSKFLLLTGFCTVAFLISLLYGFMNWKIIPVQIAAYFFNIGIHSVIAAYIGTYNYKGLDLSKGSSFNFQGIGVAQWIYALIIILVGAIIYLPFALLISSWAGISVVGILGIINLLLQDWWVDKISLQLQKRKHKILSGFREK